MCIWGFYRLSSLVTPHRMTISCRTNEFHIRSFSGPSRCLFGSSLILDLCVGSCSKRHRLCCGFQRTMAPCLTPNSYFMSELKQADSLRVVFREKQGGVSHILLRSRQQFVCDIVLDFSHSVPLSSPHSCCFDVE